jgi:hypothetical protein
MKMRKWFDKVDLYAQPAFGLNFQGRKKISTNFGVCVSIFVYILIFAFLVHQANVCINGLNPVISKVD